MLFQTWNEYVFQTNLVVIISMWMLHKAIDVLHLTWIQALLRFKLVYAAEWTLTILCLRNMWTSSRHAILPMLSGVKIPFSEYYSGDGPLSLAISRLSAFTVARIKEFLTGSHPEPIRTTLLTNTDSKQGLGKSPVWPFTSGPGLVPLGQTSEQTPIDPFLTTFKPPIVKSGSMLASTLSAQTLVEDTERISSQREPQQTKLDYVESIAPPKRQIRRRDKSLWLLRRTPDVIEDFKQEQIELLHQNWNKFDDRSAKVYYDKLQSWLLSKLFKPLIASIDELDKQFQARLQESFSECSPNELALLKIYPINIPNGFATNLVQQLISVPGYDDVGGRRYIIARTRDIGNSKRMAAFNYLAKERGMPTDSQILMHMYIKYLEHHYPRIIPPLVKPEGDVMKFLLVYFYITEDLKPQIMSENENR